MVLCACNSGDNRNRLAVSSSPYLQQHADNPVYWYEWGDEAFSKAKKENKPLLISIGYSSCHWCHLMEKESFMDTSVARLMNDNFICIKVDREERPDVDNIYLAACQLLTGSGGWPLNAFALPDGKPFFAGTYYSKPSWINLLKQITEAYKKKNELVLKQADALTKGIVKEDISFLNTDTSSFILDKRTYNNFFYNINKLIDKNNGGLSGTPKFPMPSAMEFLLQYYYLTGNSQALTEVNNTLTHIITGGMYDQVGGGFSRYATDSLWRIPHFEKMLYDNGQLISLFAHAYQVTKNELYKNILSETIVFVERELAAPKAGFYSSLNADTEEGEGEYYSWEYDSFNKVIGGATGNLMAEYFNVLPEGNWKNKSNILFTTLPPLEFSYLKKQIPEKFNAILRESKAKLLAERNKRIKPTVDTKILTAWNAIMLKGYIDAYVATGNEGYLVKAMSTAEFIENTMLGKNGKLKRNYKVGYVSVDGFLDDYAFTARAFIKLYQVTFNIHWLSTSKLITDYAIVNFYDSTSGMFNYAATLSSNLVVRKIEIEDNAIPSSNSIMAEVLYELGVYYDQEYYSHKTSRMFSAVEKKVEKSPAYYTQWCNLAGWLSYGTYEVAIMGNRAHQKNKELQHNYLPTCLFLGETVKENLPLLQSKLPKNNTLIYVCSKKVCNFPVEEVDKAINQLRTNKPVFPFKRN